MATPPVTLNEFKQFLKVSLTDLTLDTQLTSVLAAAADLVESVAGPMVARDVTVTIRNVACDGSFMLTAWPILELSDVVDHDSAAIIDVDDLDLDLTTGVVYGAPRTAAYDVTTSVGRSPVPAPLKEATMVVGEQLWQARRGPANGPNRFAQGGVPDAGQVPVYRGFAFPNRALQLVEPYRQLWVA